MVKLEELYPLPQTAGVDQGQEGELVSWGQTDTKGRKGERR